MEMKQMETPKVDRMKGQNDFMLISLFIFMMKGRVIPFLKGHIK